MIGDTVLSGNHAGGCARARGRSLEGIRVGIHRLDPAGWRRYKEDVVSALVMQGRNPRTGEVVGDPLADTTGEELEAVLDAAGRTASVLRATSPGERAAWLRAVAAAVDAAGPELISLAEAETGLPRPRLTGEVTRTTNQLELFARVLEEGSFLEATIDHADPAAQPPYPDLRRVLEPLGTVLVFTASNFPFAFSVAGGDIASALAAGCPVIVKSHPGHPGLSVRTGQIVADALAGAGAPGGSFAVVHGVDTGVAAITDRRIRACSFTGSLAGGRALHELAAGRPDPIPFYGELGSLNPVLVTQAAVARRGGDIAKDYVASFTLGTGQFCTKPGLLLLPRGHGLEAALTDAADAVLPAPMLGSRIHQSFASGVGRWAGGRKSGRCVRRRWSTVPGPGPARHCSQRPPPKSLPHRNSCWRSASGRSRWWWSTTRSSRPSRSCAASAVRWPRRCTPRGRTWRRRWPR